MKFHWGTGITIFFISFVAFMLFMAYKSYQTDFDLVTEDYYAQELLFQNVIDKKKNAELLPETFKIKKSDKGILVQFSDELSEKGIQGKIHFFRSSNKELDKIFELQPNSDGAYFFQAQHFVAGPYKVIVDWQTAEIPYYAEQIIVF